MLLKTEMKQGAGLVGISPNGLFHRQKYTGHVLYCRSSRTFSLFQGYQ